MHGLPRSKHDYSLAAARVKWCSLNGSMLNVGGVPVARSASTSPTMGPSLNPARRDAAPHAAAATVAAAGAAQHNVAVLRMHVQHKVLRVVTNVGNACSQASLYVLVNAHDSTLAGSADSTSGKCSWM